MIPILYDTNENSFADNGLGRLRDMIEAKVSEERNGVYELDFSYPVSAEDFDDIQIGRIVAVTHDDSGDIQPFDIVSYTKPIDGVVTFHCTHISYRQSYMTVTGRNINSLASAFTLLKNNAIPANPFTYETDKASTGYMSSADGVPKTVRSMLGGIEGSILDTYGGEYEWDKFRVILHAERGQFRNFSIRYGVNMLDYNEELDSSGTYMSCIPYWTNGTNAVVGDKQTVSGVTITNRDECVPLNVSDKFENQPTKAQVNAMGRSVMSSNNPTLPSQNIHVEFVRLQDMGYDNLESLLECKLCDTINVVFPFYNTSGQFKIVKTVWDVLANRYESMELGNLSTTLSEALGISSTTTKAPASVVEEEGTSGNWTFRKWSNGKIEAWGTDSKSVACTTSSAPYGGYRTANEITWSIPSGIFTATPNYVFGMKNGANAFKLVNLRATSTTQLGGYFSCGESATQTVTMSFYVVQKA